MFFIFLDTIVGRWDHRLTSQAVASSSRALSMAATTWPWFRRAMVRGDAGAGDFGFEGEGVGHGTSYLVGGIVAHMFWFVKRERGRAARFAFQDTVAA